MEIKRSCFETYDIEQQPHGLRFKSCTLEKGHAGEHGHWGHTKVLDHGFVNLVEHMGDDRGVVQAARVSYRSDGSKGEEADRKLIRFLLEHHHGTPFEHAILKFHVKAPIFVARQWFRHRMSSYNEVSARYTEMKDEFYVPAKWREQSGTNKQGSVEADLPHGDVSDRLWEHCTTSMALYRRMLDAGIAREMARMALPVNLYTEWYWTVNARALMHFFGLRLEAHAQWEIQQYAQALWPMFRRVMPWTAEAYAMSLPRSGYPALV